jgi:large subunit ribosomal protein L10e
MRLSFGKAVGTAARVAPGQEIFTVYTIPQYLPQVKTALKSGGHKLPSPSYINISERTVPESPAPQQA